MSGIMNDLKGKRFGRLTALYNSDKRSSAGGMIWMCLCICGSFIEVRGSHLETGNTKSCGCLRIDSQKRTKYKHGEARRNLETRLYRIWHHMKIRCYSLKNQAYKYYGGRGIQVCDEWKNDFIPFRSWALANGYQENLTIDRINNEGNYEPNNCQWLTKSENTKKQNKEIKRLKKEGRE